MIHALTKKIDSLISFDRASAHCDIPCGIYDPSTAIIAALSVLRVMDIMADAASSDKSDLEKHNSLTRGALQKEEEAEKVKHEIRIIWGDYIKAPQIEKHPDIHDLTHKIMLKGSACKQGVNRADAEELVELVNQFAEKFWDTKGIETERKTSPYAPAVPVVYPILP
ncbi:MAG: superoxide dismutase, Ni [Pseudomonadota bacterium]